MRGGSIAGELPAAGATEEDVLRLASVGAGQRTDGFETEETGA
jgi:hypothetical protein